MSCFNEYLTCSKPFECSLAQPPVDIAAALARDLFTIAIKRVT